LNQNLNRSVTINDIESDIKSLPKKKSLRPDGFIGQMDSLPNFTKKTLLKQFYACNPSYSGDRDQEDYGSKPAQGKVM
jgi:hypothetical protein